MIKRTITIFNDLHRYGPHPLSIELDWTNPNSYYLGDNVDLSHCLREDVMSAYEDLRFYKRVFEGRFVRGNHELNAVSGPDWIKVGNTLLTHGDFIFWPKKYAMHYRTKRPKGVSFLRRWISCSGLDPFRYLIPEAKLHIRTKRKLFHMAKRHGCTMIVCGHRHPKNRIDIEYKGVRMIVLPPGKNIVEIE